MYLPSETAIFAEFRSELLKHRSSIRVAPSVGRSSRIHLHNLKGAAMDMMWLFATVMGALLLGGIIVYKKSA